MTGMADDADRAQEQAETMEALRLKYAAPRRPFTRASYDCVDCGEEIEAIRLRALPTALRCVFCQTEHERMEQRYAR
jgi:phage/conjugal plasmid C-4 type zinc finger TraR family protein